MRSRQLLAFRFGSDSKFEGQLVGALERIESGGALRVLDGLFVARDPGSGALSAISLGDAPPSRMVSRILGFRLEPRERERATERALAGSAGEAVRALAETLAPGSAIAAVLVEHAWAAALGDAVARVGGDEVVSEWVEAGTVPELTSRLLGAAGGPGGP